MNKTLHIAQTCLSLVGIAFALYRHVRWRKAKSRGITPAQFSRAEGRTPATYRTWAKQSRWVGWILIALPLIYAALTFHHHNESISTFVGEVSIVEFVFAALGALCLWSARSNETYARRLETER